MALKKIDDTFWNKRIEVTRTSTLPSMLDQLKITGRWDCLKLKWNHGDPNTPHIFWDSDIAKFVEGLCYGLQYMDKKDSQYAQFVVEWIDEAVDMIQAAQGPDGYINTYFTVVEPENRWKNICHQHELYCAGHLLESAIGHYESTGSERFLDVMCRYIDYICQVFGPKPGQKHGYPGHPEIELALVRLYAVRPEKRYYDLLNYFVEQRGYNNAEFYDQEARERGDDPLTYIHRAKWPTPRSYWYCQSEDLTRNLTEIKGHSVRAMYYLAGVQGLANINGDKTLDDAVQRLWRNMIDTKLYIHGGIGAIKQWEGFGDEYELPLTCYAETCASIGILFLGKQMLERKLEREVAQVMERALYNDVLGGISIDGRSFYYDQPLVGMGMKRQDWFKVSCCPPNVSRLFNSLDKYVFTVKRDFVAVNLWIGSVYCTDDVNIKITTSYPHQGFIQVDISTQKPLGFAIRAPEQCQLSTELPYQETNGYLCFDSRIWDDKIVIEFELPTKIIHPNPKVESTKGKLAIERGPFVYALEQSGYSGPLSTVSISDETQFEKEETSTDGAHYVALNAVLDEKGSFCALLRDGQYRSWRKLSSVVRKCMM